MVDAETTIHEFGKELKMQISCNAVDVPFGNKNHLACAVRKTGGFNDPIFYLKIDANYLEILKNPKGQAIQTHSLRDIGW